MKTGDAKSRVYGVVQHYGRPTTISIMVVFFYPENFALFLLKEGTSMKKIIPYIIILIGLLVVVYPFASNLYSSYWENQMLEEAEVLLDSGNADGSSEEEDLSETVTINFSEMNQALADEEEPKEEPDEGEQATKDPAKRTPIVEGPTDNDIENLERGAVIGKIEIPSIDVNLPLLFGSDGKTLDRGAGQIIGTAAPGEIGNTAIAGHRANRDGRFFYRLNELDVGDEIIIQTQKGTFTYTVYATKIVDPTDLSVLNHNKTDRVVTLITCHPRYTADYRLIVHGQLTKGNSL